MLRKNMAVNFAAQVFALLFATLFFTTAALAADGGLLQVTVQKSPQDPIVGITVYLFDHNGSYLGLNQVTDMTGIVGFNLSDGTYKVRANYLGYEFWSDDIPLTSATDIILTIPHQDVAVTVEGIYQAAEPLAGVPVYLFTEAGAYMNQTQPTDAAGRVVFNLPDQSYKVRADYVAQQHWSADFTWQDVSITVPMAEAQVQVTANGIPLQGINVYVFSASGAYLGFVEPTDASGTVAFRLPAGAYKFRADYQSSQYWSVEETLTAGQVNAVGISTGGGEFSFTVFKGANDHLAGVSCYVFSEAGTYLGMTEVTSSEGLVTFNLADGSYKFRVDYLGYQFWGMAYAVPATLTATLTIPHQDVAVTVEGNYQAAEPLAGVPVYLFTEAGAYMNQTQPTDDAGRVVFNLPDQSYKVRADYLAQQYWSADFTWQDVSVTVPMAEAQVQVTANGIPLQGINVYAFSASGAYLGFVEPTDASGTVAFGLPAGAYKFRADYQSSQYWSVEESLTAGQVNAVGISTGGGEFSFTVFKGVDDHLAGVSCYVFSEAGIYLGMTEVTSSEGLVTFNLADGSYKFRVDYLGYQFWSPVYTVPDTLSALLTIPHQDVTITVESNYQAAEPLVGVPLYLFTESGKYLNQIQTTNAAGQVVFSLPEQPYQVRADYLAQQYWSDEFIWLDAVVTVPMAEAEVQVTGSGVSLEGVDVYVFSASGIYLSLMETTNTSGTVSFRLPADTYKFRADYQNSQYWSAEEALTAGQVNAVEISTGGGVFSFTVLKGANDHLAGVNCYVFNGSGTYLGMTEVTSSEGLVTFNLADGNYKYRVDYLGYQFWSPVYTVPDTLTATLTIPHQDMTITIEGSYQGPEPLAAVRVYLFTEAGSYLNQNLTTNAAGQVVFNLADQPYKVRADYLGQQFWSAPFQSQDTTVTINQGLAGIHVTRSGSDVAGAKVYLFSENDAYLGWFETTDEAGNAEFLLPNRSFKFRIDEGADQQWTPVVAITAGVLNNVEVDFTPVAVSISADPETITAGDSANLTWNSTAADSCVIEPGIGVVDVNGSISVIPTETITYTITATGPGGSATDSATVTVSSPPSISEFKLKAGDAEASDQFGHSVSISGDYAIVGAYGDDDGGNYSGSAYIFKREGSSWIQQAKLTAGGDFFGYSVSIRGDYAIVGAYGDRDGGLYSGAAYIFKREGSSWIQQAKLTAGDAEPYDYFGRSVSIDGDYAIVGAYGDDDGGVYTGAAYIFKRLDSSWIQQAKLTAADAAADDEFGKSVSISGDYAIVGADRDDDGGVYSGSAYIFKRDGSSWTQQAKLTADDATGSEHFGFSVSIDGDYAVVGAFGAHGDDAGEYYSGSAYIFKREGSSWIQQAKLTAADAAAVDFFGTSVAIDSDYAIVGAYLDDDGGDSSGSAYIFRREGSSWIQQGKLTAGDAAAGDVFGSSVSLDGDYAIVGAYGDDDDAVDSGSAYIYPLIFPSVNIDSDPKVIQVGESATLTWTSTNTDTCFIEPGIGEVAVDGSIIVSPSETTTYTITATGPEGTATDSVTVFINYSPSITVVEPDGVDDTADTNFTIQWMDDDPDDNAAISLYYDTDNSGADGTLIVSGLSEDGDVGGDDEYIWDTSDIAEGAYYVYAVIYDGVTDPVWDYSEGAVAIEHGPPSWAELKLTAGDITEYDDFGISVSISGDYAIVGSDGHDDGGDYSGSAYIFKREGSIWSQQAKLTAGDSMADHGFGYRVSIDGDYAIVGAYGDDDNGSLSGSAYIFKRDGSSWIQQAKLTAGDAAEYDYFGISVSIDGDYAIVGSDGSGSAYIFKRDGSSWIQQAKLTAGDDTGYDSFGASVSIDSDYAIVGAKRDYHDGSICGSAYIFKRDGSSWSQQVKLTASDAAEYDYFGVSVSIGGDYAIVGSKDDDDNGNSSGSAYIFKRDGLSWSQQAKLTAGDAAENDSFGKSVSVSSDYAIVGAFKDDNNGSYSGSAYIFKRDGSSWIQQAKLTADDATEGDWFGVSVSIDSGYAIVGAYGDDDGGERSGAAYIYSLPFPFVNIDSDPAVLQVGESATLTWNSTNTDTCFIEPGIGEVAVDGSTIVSPSKTTVYTITATGPEGTTTESVTVLVYDPAEPIEVGIAVEPLDILYGESSTLTWSSTNATSCVIEPGIGPVDLGGSITVSPSETTTYIITATNPVGTNTGTVTVTVAPPPTVNITANCEAIKLGESCRLEWNSTAADSAVIDQGIGSVPVNGSMLVSPTETNTYTITAIGPYGSFTDSATVFVNYAPSITLGEPDGVDDTASSIFTIRWMDDDPDDNATISLYYDTDNSGADGTLIVSGLSENLDGAAGEYVWFTAGITEGAYYIYGVIDDGINDPVVDYGDGVVTVIHGPELKLVAGDAEAYDKFGNSVSISGDYAIVGSSGDDDHGDSSGAAYIFKRNGTSWAQQAKLTAGDAAAGDNFGSSVSINGDYAIVGARGDDAGVISSGSAYIFRREGSSWIQQAKLTADDAEINDEFGYSVSINGEYAVVGTYAYKYDDDGSLSGSAYIFKRLDSSWIQQAKLTADDAEDYDRFGQSVSIDGDYVVVGAYNKWDGVSGSGAVYIFKRDGETWTQQTKLTTSDGAMGYRFGYSVDIDGSYLVVGAPGSGYELISPGAAYIFRRDAETWTAKSILTAFYPEKGYNFGASVAIDRDYVAVGATGGWGMLPAAAYIYKRSGEDVWTEQACLSASDGAAWNYFGGTVALSGDYAVVGAYENDSAGSNSGAAYIYSLPKFIGTPFVAVVEPDGERDTADSAYILRWVDVDPDSNATVSLYYDVDNSGQDGILIVSGLNEDPDGAANEYVWNTMAVPDGAYYVYAVISDGVNDPVAHYSISAVTIENTIYKEFKFAAADTPKKEYYTNYRNNFGSSVAVSGDYAVVGADFGGDSPGAAYIFKRIGIAWFQQAKLIPSDSATDQDNFGGAVSISGDYAIVGAWSKDGVGSDSGAAYIFMREGVAWTQQAKLTASDSAAADWFGGAVSISGDYAVVGAHGDDDGGFKSGTAYIFKREGEVWAQQVKLTAPQSEAYDYFGSSVSIKGDYAIVGASGDDDQGNASGAAYVFVRVGSAWVFQAKLIAGDGADGDSLGSSAAISGNYAVVSSYGSEAAYIFKRQGSIWTEQAKLLAADGASSADFGSRVAISGNNVLVGGDWYDGTGSAYLFKRDEESWVQEAKLTASDSARNDEFATSMGLGGIYAIVGAGGAQQAYIYTISEVDISVEHEVINIGETTTLSWSFADATSVTIDNGIGAVSQNGSISVSPTETTTYTITAEGPGGTFTDSVTVTVVFEPNAYISADPMSLGPGDSSTLTWSCTTNAETCVIEPGIGDVDLNGSLEVTPTETTTYTITATNQWGTADSSITVVVVWPQPSVDFSADPAAIFAGETTTLTWQTQYAEAVTIEPDLGSQDLSGSAVATPTAPTTYTLTASGPGGTRSETVTVTVNRIPGIYYEYDALGRIIKITRVPNK